MLKKRIIPCLDVRDGRVVKGTQFKDLAIIDDPLSLALKYNREGADELVLYDISASIEQRAITTQLISKIAGALSIPLTVGGGIVDLDSVKRLFSVGADKVSLNSGAIKNPNLISQSANHFGSQNIVGSIDVAYSKHAGTYRIFTAGGQKDTGRDALTWARTMVELGCGELVVNSIDSDGLRNGYDIAFLERLSEHVNVPLIASGGAGCVEHFEAALRLEKVTGALAASLFHYKALTISSLKQSLQEKGVPIRCLSCQQLFNTP